MGILLIWRLLRFSEIAITYITGMLILIAHGHHWQNALPGGWWHRSGGGPAKRSRQSTGPVSCVLPLMSTWDPSCRHTQGG